MGNRMADHFLSFMVFIFKAFFLKTLKFQLCRYFSLRRVDEFSWDKKQIILNLYSYGSKSCNFKIFMYFFMISIMISIYDKYDVSIFSMIKTLKIQKNGKNYCKKISFWHEKNRC